MILWVAIKVMKSVGVRDVEYVDGKDEIKFRPPTSNIGFRVKEPEDTEVVLISHGDSFDLIHGKDPSYIAIPISPKAALKMAWFILWKWWFRGTWMGWKMRAWQWSTSVILEEAVYEQQRRRKAYQRSAKAASTRPIR